MQAGRIVWWTDDVNPVDTALLVWFQMADGQKEPATHPQDMPVAAQLRGSAGYAIVQSGRLARYRRPGDE